MPWSWSAAAPCNTVRVTARGIGVFLLGAFLAEIVGVAISWIGDASDTYAVLLTGGLTIIFGWALGGVIAVLIWRKRRIPTFKICPRCAESVKAQATACRFCGYGFGQAGLAEEPAVVANDPRRLDVVGLTSPEYDRVDLYVLQSWLAYWEGVAAGTEEPTPGSGETVEMAPGEITKLTGEIAAREAAH